MKVSMKKPRASSVFWLQGSAFTYRFRSAIIRDAHPRGRSAVARERFRAVREFTSAAAQRQSGFARDSRDKRQGKEIFVLHACARGPVCARVCGKRPTCGG